MLQKSKLTQLPDYFDRYINLVPNVHLNTALAENGDSFFKDHYDQLIDLGDKVYAPEKWTIKDIIQHIIDTERIFSYRALRLARKDKTPLHGFDENLYAAHANATHRSLDNLTRELELVRQSTIHLFESFTEEDIMNVGICSGLQISVLALGFTIAGHGMHHINVIKERYFALLA